jgi:hypothetical protein
MSDRTAKRRLAVVIGIAKQLDKQRIGLPTAAFEEKRLPAELRLNNNKSSYLNQCILDAFTAFDLDPRFPVNWQVLTGLLAHVLFSKPRPGGLRTWTDEQLCTLLASFASVKRKRPNASDSAICNWLEKRYASTSAATLRRRLQDARNPAHNRALAAKVDTLMLKRRTLANHAAWTEADDEKARAECLQQVLIDADEFFGPK